MATIFALSSGVGRAAVAVIRVSGPAAGDAVRALCGPLPAPRCATLKTLRRPSDGAALDRGLVLWFPAPDSYTAEDSCEFQVHGGRAVVEALFDVLRSLGLRMAEPGEFSRRAFDNGKLDLSELEGIADLVAAETEMQRRSAVAQSTGSLRTRCERWQSTLLDLRAQVEARLDFSDEGDVPEGFPPPFYTSLESLKEELTIALGDARHGERLRDGLKVAILGPPNAGKSTLLNALARREVAIVTEEAGTTRDVLEVLLDLDGYPVRVFDTAGIREAGSLAERIGIERAVETGRDADLVLWLQEVGDRVRTEPPTPSCVPFIRIVSKVDLCPGDPITGIGISAHGGLGLDALSGKLRAAAGELLGRGSGIVTRARHAEAVSDARDCLTRVWDGEEVLAELLRSASQAIGRITGQVDPEAVFDRLFAEFCIGK